MKNLVYSFLAGALGLSMLAGAAAQTSGDATVEITSDLEKNILSVSISETEFHEVEFGFDPQDTTGLVKIVVKDDTGTASGWNVTIYGSDLESTTTSIIPIKNLSIVPAIEAPLVSDAGQDISGITQTGTGAVSGDSASAFKTLSAAEDRGSGHYTAQYDATLSVPGNTLVGNYTGSLTVSIDSAP